jgi:hypothetical protein
MSNEVLQLLHKQLFIRSVGVVGGGEGRRGLALPTEFAEAPATICSLKLALRKVRVSRT